MKLMCDTMLIAGIDEAGRGPVVGPLVMAIFSIDIEKEQELRKIGVKDSKLLSPEQREKLFPKLKKIAKEFYCKKIDAYKIDEMRKKDSLNFIELKITAELINKLKKTPDKIYVDCPQTNTESYKEKLEAYLDFDTKLVVENKADFNYPVVGAASIIAKVERDKEIKKLEKKYKLEIGTGYPHDPATIRALKELDKLCPKEIRKSWSTYQTFKDNEKQKKLF